jgi:hypothetical protein
VAKRLGRRFVGIERDAAYAAAARDRIAAVEPLPDATLASFQTAREAPRVPFSALIERGMISPGDKLTDAKRRVKALVRADGAVALGDAVGSIHRIGALAQGLEACNGWTFWHVETKGGLRVIDALRAQVRAGMARAASAPYTIAIFPAIALQSGYSRRSACQRPEQRSDVEAPCHMPSPVESASWPLPSADDEPDRTVTDTLPLPSTWPDTVTPASPL